MIALCNQTKTAACKPLSLMNSIVTNYCSSVNDKKVKRDLRGQVNLPY